MNEITFHKLENSVLSENLGGEQKCWGYNLPHPTLVYIGLTDLPKSGGMRPSAPPLPTSAITATHKS